MTLRDLFNATPDDFEGVQPYLDAVKDWLERKRREYIQKNRCFSERVIGELLEELE